MTTYEILQQRATSERDRLAEALSETRSKLTEHSGLLARTEEIGIAYEEKMKLMQKTATSFGDLQLYQTSLKQIQQAIVQIRMQIELLNSELLKRRQLLAKAELERQKYSKLVEREGLIKKALARRLESRELDEVGSLLHHRKQKLA